MSFAARRTLALLATGAMAAAVLPVAGSSADAAGERVQETGRVKAVADGDTLWVDIAGDGTKKRYLIRLAGVQATETKHKRKPGSTNWCHGKDATSVLTQLTKGRKVQLRAASGNSRSQGRLLRHVYVKRGGTWVDVQKYMLERSQVMNLNFLRETTGNATYGALAQAGSYTGTGLWNTSRCGVGPQQTVPLRTWIHWDAAGVDAKNVNDEYVVFENRSSTERLSLAGWMVRDTSLAVYRFPTWASIAPGSFIRLRVGKGRNSATDFYWGLNYSLFQNPDKNQHSDFAILMDPRGDFRSWASYPCRVRCADPLAGAVKVTRVEYDPDGDDNKFVNSEEMVITNSGAKDVRLSGYYVMVSGWLSYTFSPNRVLPAGSSLTIKMGKGNADADTVYMNQASSHLVNGGGTVEVRNWNGVRVSCKDWGNKRC